MKRLFLKLLLLFSAVCAMCCAAGCSSCDSAEPVSENLHVHEYDDWVVTKTATCTEDGERERYCSCGEKQTGKIGALGHDYILHEAQQATCIQGGWKEYRTCLRCDYSSYESIPALGHTESDWITENEPDCENDGLRYKKCAVCSERVEIEVLSAEGHDLSEWITEEVASCSHNGLKFKECNVCFRQIVTEILPTLPHTESEWITESYVDCEIDGVKYIECEVCSERLQTETISAYGHKYGDWRQLKEPTCTASGLNVRVCSHNDKHTDEQVIPALGHVAKYNYDSINHYETCTRCESIIGNSPHSWQEDKCTVCGYVKEKLNGLSFISYNDVSYTVTGIGSCDDLRLVIPSEYNGKPVTDIAQKAFCNCSFTSVVVPGSITYIGEMAFSGCSNLESISLPFIGSYGTIDENTYFGIIFGAISAEENADYVPVSLKTVKITGNITSIAKNAFLGCKNIREIEIPASVKTIESGAFNGCSALRQVTIPASVTSIGEYAFDNCGLTEVNFEVTDGWGLFDGNGNKENDVTADILSDPEIAKNFLTNKYYCAYIWKRN